MVTEYTYSIFYILEVFWDHIVNFTLYYPPCQTNQPRQQVVEIFHLLQSEILEVQ